MIKIKHIFFIFVFLLSTLTAQLRFEYSDLFQAPNGMQILGIKNKNIPLVSTILVIKTGLKDETPKINGVSHMLEHMIFNGTKNFTQKELYDFIDENGLYVNAQTSEDYIAFIGIGEASRSQQLFKLLSDMICNSVFPKDKFNKEKGIIISELARQENSPDFQQEMDFKKWLYGEKSIYSFPVLGDRNSIKRISREQLINYYKAHFIPSQMLLFVYGNYTSSFLKAVPEMFGNGSKKEITEKKSPFVIEAGSRIIKDGQLYKYQFKIPGPQPENGLYPYFYLMNETIFNHSSFWMNFIPDTLKSVFLSFKPEFYFHSNGSIITIEALLKDSLDIRTIDPIAENALVQFGNKITEHEVKKWIKELWINENLMYDQPMYFAFLKAPLLSIYDTREYIKYLPFLQQYKESVKKWYSSYLEQILREKKYVSNTYFKDFSYSPEKSNRKTAQKKSKKEIKIFQEDGYPTYIIQKVPNSKLQSVHILFKNKYNMENNKNGIAELLHWLFGRRSKNWDEHRIDSLFSESGIKIKWHDNYYIPFDDYYFSSQWGYIRSIAIKDFWNLQLKILGECIQNIDVDSSSFQQNKLKLLQLVEKKEKNPNYVIQYAFFKNLLSPIHWLAIPPYGYSKNIKRITRKEIISFAKLYTSNSNLIISVISPKPITDVKTVLDSVFHHYKELHTQNDFQWNVSEPFKDSIKVSEHAKNISFYMGILLNPKIGDFSEEELAIYSDIIRRKLIFEIREKKGWAYSLSSKIMKIGNNWFWLFNGSIKKGTIDPVLTIVKKVITSIPEDISEKNFIISRESEIAHLVRRYSSMENLSYLLGYTYYKNPDIRPNYLNNLLNEKIKAFRSIKEKGITSFIKNFNMDSLYIMYTY